MGRIVHSFEDIGSWNALHYVKCGYWGQCASEVPLSQWLALEWDQTVTACFVVLLLPIKFP